MNQIATLEDAIIAKYQLERFMLDSPRGWLGSGKQTFARLPPAQLEWSVEWGKLILSWWDDSQSQSLRIVGYAIEQSRIVLQGKRGLMTEPIRLVFDRQIGDEVAAFEIPPERLTERRVWYGQLLARLIREQIPAVRVRHHSTGADHHHRVPGRYARMVLSRRGETILAIGASAGEVPAVIDGITAAGLVWFENYNLERNTARQARQLWFFLPRDHSLTAMERLPLLKTGAGTAGFGCYEVDEIRHEIRQLQPVAQMELLSSYPRELLWPAETESLDRAGAELHRRILSLAPELIETRYRPGGLISYAINGLEFARLPINDHLSANFAVAGDPFPHDPRQRSPFGTPLDQRTMPELRRLVERLIANRNGTAREHRHPFYRLRTEAWLESLLRSDIRRLDPELDPSFVYSQIPTWHADQRSVIDLLSVKRDGPDRGRMVVIEIKAAEDLQLPIQGLDYWLRVEQARARGEFARRQLFDGVQLADRSPLLYLVAPRLRFHRNFTIIARCLNPEIAAYRVGLNANWREGIRVHSMELLQSL